MGDEPKFYVQVRDLKSTRGMSPMGHEERVFGPFDTMKEAREEAKTRRAGKLQVKILTRYKHKATGFFGA